ncbi:MAG TPA: prohibitin family protein [Gammaproteobacteria bacterium]|nr:prohibitin family protein [Gammaproteobacteria bacterium]
MTKIAPMLVIPVVIVLILIVTGFYTIPAGERGVLLTFNAVQPGVVLPGAHVKIPFVQSVRTMNVQVQKFAAQESAASKDLQDVTTTVAVNFHLDPKKVEDLYKDVGTAADLETKIVAPAVSNAVKAVTARFNAEDLVSNRDTVRKNIEQEVRSALEAYSAQVDAVNITDFKFSSEYSHAIELKQVAQQRALQAQYELEKVKIDAQQSVVRAEASAKATVVAAQAEAQALQLKQKAVTPELIMLDAVQKWNGQLPTMMTGSGMAPIFDTSRLLPASGAVDGRPAK